MLGGIQGQVNESHGVGADMKGLLAKNRHCSAPG
jgi:hypothetical protein